MSQPTAWEVRVENLLREILNALKRKRKVKKQSWNKQHN